MGLLVRGHTQSFSTIGLLSLKTANQAANQGNDKAGQISHSVCRISLDYYLLDI